MRNSFLRKGYTLCILSILIIGTYFYPLQVHANNLETTIQIQFPGLQGMNTEEITLSEKQTTILTQTISTIKNQLKNTHTKDEALTCIIDAITHLQQSHILTHTQYLQTIHALTFWQQISNNQYIQQQTISVPNCNISNYLCIVTGETTNAKLINPVERSCTSIIYGLFVLFFLAQFIGLGENLFTYINSIRDLHNSYQDIRPSVFPGLGIIAFGVRHISPSPPNQLKTYPADGWIAGAGIRGQNNINGTFIGKIRSIQSSIYDYYTYFIGINGFIGLSITQNNGKHFFLGIALQIQTESYPAPPYP